MCAPVDELQVDSNYQNPDSLSSEFRISNRRERVTVTLQSLFFFCGGKRLILVYEEGGIKVNLVGAGI